MRTNCWICLPWIGVLLSVGVLLLGGMSAEYHASVEERLLRNKLLNEVELLARSIPPVLAEELTFTEADRGTMAFERLAGYLRAFSIASGIESVFTMALRNGNEMVFGPEAIDPASELASPPGTPYEDPTELDWLTLREGVPTVNGPFTDEYGTFVGALAPVFHPRSGKIIMAVGLDIEASAWSHWLLMARAPSVALTLLLLALVWTFVILSRRQSKSQPGMSLPTIPCEAIAIVLCGVVLALMAGRATMSTIRADAILGQYDRTNAFFNYFIQEIRRIENSIESMAAFLEIHPDPTPAEFQQLAWKKMKNAAIDLLGWAPRVSKNDLPVLEATLMREHAEFQGLYATDEAGNKTSLPEADEYFVTTRVESASGEGHYTGFVINSEARRIRTLERAKKTRLIECTRPIRFVGSNNASTALAMYLVVNQQDTNSVRGVIAAGIRPEELLRRDAGLLGMNLEADRTDSVETSTTLDSWLPLSNFSTSDECTTRSASTNQAK